MNKKNWKILRLSNVLYVLQLAANIFNLGHLDEEGYQMTMAGGKLTIFIVMVAYSQKYKGPRGDSTC